MKTYIEMLNDTDEFKIEAREKIFTLTKKSARKFLWSFRWKFGCFDILPLFSCLEHIKAGESKCGDEKGLDMNIKGMEISQEEADKATEEFLRNTMSYIEQDDELMKRIAYYSKNDPQKIAQIINDFFNELEKALKIDSMQRGC
jgi:flagellar biosynthesis/type III secretory pathway M-ring protein FliF/YscJ